MQSSTDGTTLAGTLGGTFLTLLGNIPLADVSRTVFLAAVGAVVSFLVSLGLQFVRGWIKRRRKS
ncbi:hypothetical protein E1171_01460 [Cytophagales bacterium RKSG123]|nr:hypothetical protein [Xanthovirga aplysinae]